MPGAYGRIQPLSAAGRDRPRRSARTVECDHARVTDPNETCLDPVICGRRRVTAWGSQWRLRPVVVMGPFKDEERPYVER